MDARKPRWQGDNRRRGEGTGAQIEPSVRQMLDEIGDDGWITEQPLDHLGPKVRAWLEADGSRRWSATNLVVRDLVLEIRATWVGSGRMRDLRADAYALIGSFAEDVAFVRQAVGDASVTFTVATGQPATAKTAAHGHLVVVVVSGEGAQRAATGTQTGGQ